MVMKYEVGVGDGEELGGRGSKRSEGGEGVEGQTHSIWREMEEGKIVIINRKHV